MNRLTLFNAAVRPDQALIERFGRLNTPSISDNLERNHGCVGVHAVGACLTALGITTIAGPALTVRTRPGDNLVVHKAMDLAQPGDILVIDAHGEVTNAILGEIMCRYARSRGIAGIIVDGAVRDCEAIGSGILPVFARGVSHLGPYKSGPGEIHGAVNIGGMTVNDGDIVVGDADGVVVVPAWRAEEAVHAAEAVVEMERQQVSDIDNGTLDRIWIDEVLEVKTVDEIQRYRTA
ncbi:RraA family protein [Halomonas ramblicola]|uniref:RraA family protein n=1 Tax=Halomonas ramblicola TaxID=747349 RepID=UPI0025B53EB4|nr:RraA family protein [Halomonas ramblicola]MDN3523587.1 RraA family protein [Halomonas ramblicola]